VRLLPGSGVGLQKKVQLSTTFLMQSERKINWANDSKQTKKAYGVNDKEY
jgi:hypothetical protein